jgi:hypothetical protein
MSSVIGITGRKYSGKDTVGQIVVDDYGYTRIAFADPLKETCRLLFGFSNEQLHGSLKEVVDDYWGTTPRSVLQFVGTDLFRNQLEKVMPDVGEHLWVAITKKKMHDLWSIDPETKFVITDVRFNNEVAMVKLLNGVVWKVNRPISNDSDYHLSEQGIDQLVVDHVIDNTGSMEELEEKIKKLCE